MEKITHHEGTGHNRPYPIFVPLWKSKYLYQHLAFAALAVCLIEIFIGWGA